MAIAQYLTDDEKRAVKQDYHYSKRLGYWQCRCPMAIALDTRNNTPPSGEVARAIFERRPELEEQWGKVVGAVVEFINWYDPENTDPRKYRKVVLEAIGYEGD